MISRLVATLIDHFIVVCLVAWPLNESEAGVDFCYDRNLTTFLMRIATNQRERSIIKIRKAWRFPSKQVQHQPHFHSKARHLSTRL